ncbi:MAG: ATP-dependent sacrificial sulfur transferase LarE [Planctomycetes bacterium]|nr:ATP-dependent sacrificial sulfur transferase LarE [Planctomycetota bacterium]
MIVLSETLQAKYDRMCEILRSLEHVAVAFSAGVDSTLVLKVALDTLGSPKVIAATGDSESLARAEFDEARRLTEQLGAQHVVLKTDEFQNEDYLANPENRCYFCKTTLYTHLDKYIAEHGINAIVNGINADDYGDWRPGIQAAEEHQVRAPIAEAGITKAEVRTLSEWLGLPTFDKPASPCLSSRVQYGEQITPEKLGMIERAEALLKSLGFRECRVRHHNNLARIEVPLEDIAKITEPETRARIDACFRELGYNYVTVDLRGFRSGSLNEVISLNIKR